MKLFAGSIFTDQELVFYGLYIIVCLVAIVSFLFFMIRILSDVIKKKPLIKSHVIFLALSALVVLIANIVIDL